MALRLDQLASHLAGAARQGFAPIYTLFGDEPLLALEAADQIRQAGRQAGFGERQVFTVAGAHYDWARVLDAASAMSLFGDRQLIEIRIPSGKPGTEGSKALQRYAELARGNEGLLTLVSLPKLDKTQQGSDWFSALEAAGQTLRCDPIERGALALWVGQRLAQQGQAVEPGVAGQRSLAFFADQVEGNLMAAHQEVLKLGLLYPAGALSFEQIEAAVTNVARFGPYQLSEATLAGDRMRALRMLASLQAEGEAEVVVLNAMAGDILGLHRGRLALDAGKPLPMVMRELRIWGTRERLIERALPQLRVAATARLLLAASTVDGITKGLPDAAWPRDGWQALGRLALMMCQAVSLPRRT